MSKTKNTKVAPVEFKAKLMEASMKQRFRDTPSEAKISGDISQNFNRVLDIVAIPGWGVEIKLKPTEQDPRTSRRMSYHQAYDLVVPMTRMLDKLAFDDAGAVAEMFTKFKLKLLEAIQSDPT